VGLTRAKERLYLTHCFRRSTYGDVSAGAPSRFLNDIPRQLLEGAAGTPERTADGRDRQGSARRGERALERETRWERGPSAKPGIQARFRMGMRVRHATFGEGIVVKSELQGTTEEVTVIFEGVGVGMKRLDAALAKLEIIQ
jgi:DNA helicase-2/ATP-dependent DNA helicase PcrA